MQMDVTTDALNCNHHLMGIRVYLCSDGINGFRCRILVNDLHEQRADKGRKYRK